MNNTLPLNAEEADTLLRGFEMYMKPRFSDALAAICNGQHKVCVVQSEDEAREEFEKIGGARPTYQGLPGQVEAPIRQFATEWDNEADIWIAALRHAGLIGDTNGSR